jgi:hypothetical protein
MKRVLFFCSMLVCLVALRVDALDFQIPEVADICGFGTILADVSKGQPPRPSLWVSSYGQVPRSDILLTSVTTDIAAPSSGSVIYVQAEAAVKTVFSFPQGGAVAMLHPERYVSFISGLDAGRVVLSAGADQPTVPRGLVVRRGEKLPGGTGTGLYPQKVFGLRLFDAQNERWVNPIFLASWIRDRTPPVIRAVRLAKSGETTILELSDPAARNARISCPQGNYRIYVDASDAIIPGSLPYSAPYRFLVLLDGKSVVDCSFAVAQCAGGGLSFLGTPGPSREAVAPDGSYSVGQIALVRGEHDLQVLVSDYAGNSSMLKALILVR